ncbi:MAG TPA: hypothetical protein VEJ18_11380, partial [Planctomycetota bacterium]|nr:hypothetical protein [Planctomycetota bacterium]
KLLSTSDLRAAAAARLGLDGEADPDLLRQALASDDPETAFTAALALGDIDRLTAALSGRDELARLAAARRLAALGVFAPLESLLRSGSEDLTSHLILALHGQKRPAPELTAALLDLVDAGHPESVRAAWVVSRACDGPTALRLVRATKGDHQVVQALLRDEAGLDPDAVGSILGWLSEAGVFRKGQWGLDQALARGVVARGLAERLFPSASDEMKIELLGLAEKQLDAADDDGIRRFLLNVVFGPYGAKVRAAAAWALRRTARRADRRADAFPPLDRASVERWFGPVAEFGRRLAAVLADDPSMREVGLYDELTTFLRSLDEGLAPELGSEALVEALLGVAGGNYSGFIGDAAIEALGKVGVDARWRSTVVAGLEAIGKRGNYAMDRALRRLQLAEHGLPEERHWPSLPLDTAPSRFAGATEAGRRELLALANQQLLEHPDAEILLVFLRDVAFGPWPPELRLEAARIHDDRSRAGWTFAPERTAGLIAALQDPAIYRDDRFRSILSSMLEGTSDDPNLAKACLDLAERGDADINLRREALAFAVRGQGSRVLERLRALKCDGAVRSDRDRFLRQLEPPVREPEASRSVPPVSRPSPGPDVYAAKAREAERLGRELQEACLKISFGPLSPEDKTREIMRLQDEFRARIQAIYGR